MISEAVAEHLVGQVISAAENSSDGALLLRFKSGSAVIVVAKAGAIDVRVRSVDRPRASTGPQPTRRQREYLQFIRKYMARHGRAPSEADIHEHFMVSAPSAHQMVKSLEQRGFITRRRDLFTGNVVPRSIRVIHEDL